MNTVHDNTVNLHFMGPISINTFLSLILYEYSRQSESHRKHLRLSKSHFHHGIADSFFNSACMAVEIDTPFDKEVLVSFTQILFFFLGILLYYLSSWRLLGIKGALITSVSARVLEVSPWKWGRTGNTRLQGSNTGRRCPQVTHKLLCLTRHLSPQK